MWFVLLGGKKKDRFSYALIQSEKKKKCTYSFVVEDSLLRPQEWTLNYYHWNDKTISMLIFLPHNWCLGSYLRFFTMIV